jgi:hypothetical protein
MSTPERAYAGGMLAIKKFLSWLLRRDFTIQGTPEPQWEEYYQALEADVQGWVPVRPPGACGAYKPKYATYRCCDCTWSSVSNSRYACVGHYGVCGS